MKDPLVFGGGSGNLYLYTSNDPVNRKDPSGKWDSWSHFTMTWVAMEASGYSTEEAIIVALYNMATDATYQDKKYAPIHSMRREGQSIESAQSEANSFLNKNMAQGTFEGLGYALHTIQDAECPQHARNVWDPKDTWSHTMSEIFQISAEARAKAIINSVLLIGRFKK